MNKTYNGAIVSRRMVSDRLSDSRTKTHTDKLSSPPVSWILSCHPVLWRLHLYYCSMNLIKPLHQRCAAETKVFFSGIWFSVVPIAWIVTLTNTIAQLILKYVCFVSFKFIVLCIRDCALEVVHPSGKEILGTGLVQNSIMVCFYCMHIIFYAREGFFMSLRTPFFSFFVLNLSNLRTIPSHLVLLFNSLYHCPK